VSIDIKGLYRQELVNQNGKSYFAAFRVIRQVVMKGVDM
jgi:hypothetical protein